ncbi:MAG: acyltransferase family protein [Lachnospiraceae bacterium]|nr:acyltransferase family protein [Lachnospiraceae bacterium]
MGDTLQDTDKTTEKAANTVRETGPDLVRVCASVFVVAVHFYLNCNYYQTPLAGGRMMAMTWGRWFFMICVPLFMMLTGYLKCHKTFSRAHYLSLVPILLTYVVIGVVKIIVSNIYYGAGYFTFLTGLKAIATYQLAWYVGMYVALMLLIPFLNKLWEALDAKQHKWLIATLAVIGSLYPLVLYVVPSYWQMLYPFVYYFLGAYIRTYRPKVNKLLAVLAILVTTTVNAAVSYLTADGALFDWQVLAQTDSGYSVLTVVIASAAFFLLFYDVNVRPRFLQKILAAISGVSLEIYLFTGVFDVIIFSYLKQTLTQAGEFFWYFFLSVPVNFICSVLAGLLLKLLLSPVTRLIRKR